MRRQRSPIVLLAALPLLSLGGCANFPFGQASLTDRECMTRAMYFESNRSSEDGMLAVGTTVMNRLATPGYPKTVCGVVGQRNQYAPGVLTQSMNSRESQRIAQVADAVLAGARHPQVGSAMFFHTAGLTFPYTNMHYVAVAGGNAFYEKVSMSPSNGYFRSAPTLSAGMTFAPRARPTTLAAAITGPRARPTTLAELLGFSSPRPRHRRTRVASDDSPYQPHR